MDSFKKRRIEGTLACANTSWEDKWKAVVFIVIGVCSWLGNYYLVSSTFENERFFSHLAEIEREMNFRSEMGLYYSYYKRIVDAPSLYSGMSQLLHDNLTEYPSTINVVNRFNIYPEILLGASYRLFRNILYAFNVSAVDCYKVERGMTSSITSCEGLGVPVLFYLEAVWICAGFTSFLIFTYGTVLSGNVVGGLLAVLSFFFNHSECTRVQWTPPLRESFAYPVLLFHSFIVTVILKELPCHEVKRKIILRKHWMVLILTWSSCASLIMWQFSQFFLVCECFICFAMYSVGSIDKATYFTLLVSKTIGHISAIAFLMGNSMLMCSFLSTFLISSWMVFFLDKNLTSHSLLLSSIIKLGLVVGFTLFLKLLLSGYRQDSHINLMFLSKIGLNQKNFNTFLYTCAPEFQAISWEYVQNITKSLLLPCSAASVLGTLVLWTVKIVKSEMHCKCPKTKILGHPKENCSPFERPLLRCFEPDIMYNFCLLLLYVFMVLVAMRLKLFLTPQLCILVSILALDKLLNIDCMSFPKKTLHNLFLAVIICAMCQPGYKFLYSRYSAIGEYNNIPLEELLSWINDFTPKTAAFAGPMPVMANIMLSTGRPIVNHPHYEDEDVRQRTQDVYSVFSRKGPYEVFLLLRKLKADFVVLSADRCFEEKQPRDSCKFTEIWDIIDLENITRPPLCPQLYNHEPVPVPFKRVFKNRQYVVLFVPPHQNF